MLEHFQAGLETLYRISTKVDIRQFIIDSAKRDAMGVAHLPREQLLLAQTGDDLELGLFVDDAALANLKERDPRQTLDGENLQDFLLTLEGVSHFVYAVWRAQGERPFSALELELQAEVDKYVTCLLMMWPQQGSPPADLRKRLFERIEFASDLAPDEHERYTLANDNAAAYAASLEARYVSNGNIADMLDELRRFYRLGAQEKFAHIGKAA